MALKVGLDKKKIVEVFEEMRKRFDRNGAFLRCFFNMPQLGLEYLLLESPRIFVEKNNEQFLSVGNFYV